LTFRFALTQKEAVRSQSHQKTLPETSSKVVRRPPVRIRLNKGEDPNHLLRQGMLNR